MVAAILMVLCIGLSGLTSIAGFAYPAYKSFQAIETKNKGDDTQWLVYWVIFALFSIVETFVGASLLISIGSRKPQDLHGGAEAGFAHVATHFVSLTQTMSCT